MQEATINQISDTKAFKRIQEARFNALNILINLTKCEAVVFGREDERSEFAAK
jgi:hypothetical protein